MSMLICQCLCWSVNVHVDLSMSVLICPYWSVNICIDLSIDDVLVQRVFLWWRPAGSQGLRSFLRVELRGSSGREPDTRPEQNQGRPPRDQGGPEPLQADQGQVVSEGESPTQGSSPVILVYFQMTQRLDLYAESLAKAIDHNYKPDIIHWSNRDRNKIFTEKNKWIIY